MKQVYPITEYGSFLSGKRLDGFETLPERTFAGLEHFILSSRSADTDALDLMGISVKKGVGKVITAKNYVGVITMKDGTSIEILPKIDSPNAYQKKYGAKLVVLLYPLCADLANQTIADFESDDGVRVRVRLFDLLDVRHSLNHIMADFND